MPRVVFDDETRSTADLTRVGAWEYAKHSGTELLCMAYKVDTSPTCLWTPGDPFPRELQRAIENRYEFWAHNAFFERCIWQHIKQVRFGFPAIPDHLWRCSAATAAALALPRSLEDAGQVLGLDMQKDKEGHRLMLQMCKPRKPRKDEDPNGLYWFEDDERKQRLYSYCIRDVDAQAELTAKLPKLSHGELKTWQLCQEINRRGLPVDTETPRSALVVANKLKAADDKRISWLTNYAVTAASQTEPLRQWLESNSDQRVPDVKAATIDRLAAMDTPEDVAEVVTIRQRQSKSSTKKYAPLNTTTDGRLRDLFMYCGASTGRWAGRRFQPQNLPRDGVKPEHVETLIGAIKCESPELLEIAYGDAMRALSMALRNMVKAKPGHRLLVVDFASIEARVLAWLAGEHWKLEAFERGEDMYVAAAERIKPGTPRQIGKVAELALGYGGGVKAFHSMAANYGVSLPDDEAETIKRRWRDAHPMVCSLWRDLERDAIEAVETGQCGDWKVEQGFLFYTLPNGRRIAYPAPEVRQVEKWNRGRLQTELTYNGVDTYTRKWSRQSTYGGKLAENVTQAVARDFLVDAMFRAEEAGYPVVGHVHDELICEVPDGWGSLAELTEIVEIVPAWGTSCPIAAEGFESERYRK